MTAIGQYKAWLDLCSSLFLMAAFLLAEACQGEQNHRHSSNSTCHCSAAGGATRPARWRRQGCPERATKANSRGEDLVLTEASRMNPYAGDSQGPAQKDRSALPQCQPEHRQQVRLGYQREVHARQHAPSATQHALHSLPLVPTSPPLDDPDAVRKHPDRRHRWRNPAPPLFVLYRFTVGGSTGHRSA